MSSLFLVACRFRLCLVHIKCKAVKTDEQFRTESTRVRSSLEYLPGSRQLDSAIRRRLQFVDGRAAFACSTKGENDAFETDGMRERENFIFFEKFPDLFLKNARERRRNNTKHTEHCPRVSAVHEHFQRERLRRRTTTTSFFSRGRRRFRRRRRRLLLLLFFFFFPMMMMFFFFCGLVQSSQEEF